MGDGRLVEAYSTLERQLGASLERGTGIEHTRFEVLLRIARSPAGLTMGALAGQIVLTGGRRFQRTGIRPALAGRVSSEVGGIFTI